MTVEHMLERASAVYLDTAGDAPMVQITTTAAIELHRCAAHILQVKPGWAGDSAGDGSYPITVLRVLPVEEWQLPPALSDRGPF